MKKTLAKTKSKMTIKTKKTKRPAIKSKAKQKTTSESLSLTHKVQQLTSKLQLALATQKESDQKMRVTNSFLESVIRRIPGSVFWKDLKGVYLGCNQHQAWMAGKKSPASIIGKTDYDFWARKEAEAFRKVDKQVIQTGKEITIEEFVTLANGKQAVYFSTKTPLKDSQGKIIGILGVSLDITKQKELEVELKTSKAQAESSAERANFYLESIVKRIPCSVYWKDKNGVYLVCNRYVAEMAGVADVHGIIGKTDYDLPWRAQADKLKKIDNEVIKKGIETTLEENAELANGQNAIYLTTKVPVRDENNKIVGILGVSMDITDRKEMERELKEAKEKAEMANRAKSEFLSGMAHDLRTPMNGMYGMVQLIRQKVNDPSLNEYFENVVTAKQTLEHLIDETLGYIKLEAGKIDLVSEPLNFRQVIQNVVMFLTTQANAKGIKLLVNYPDNIPRHLISDPHCLRRILSNLINNAVKFTDKGSVTINVECIKTNSKQATLKVDIEDTGIGIPKDKLNFVFERFSRIEETKEKYQGTGLGLAIVKAMIEKIGGTISVSSVLGKGTVFTCLLPFKVQQVTTRPSLWQRRYSDVRVLAVGENKALCERILQNLNNPNGAIAAGKETLTVLAGAKKENKPYQLVIIDDEIEGNVYELARQIHAHDHAQNPVLILLAKPGKLADVEAAQEAGFFGQLIKPVQPTELTDGVMRLWQKWQAQQTASITERLKQYPPKVLLIEDDLISAHFAMSVLQGLSCQVEKVTNGKEALEMLKQHYDIIFTDLGLPDMTGIDLAKAVRKHEGNDYPTPIIALTGHILESDKQQCLAAGMNGFLGKPVEQAELEKTLAKWVLNAGIEKGDWH